MKHPIHEVSKQAYLCFYIMFATILMGFVWLLLGNGVQVMSYLGFSDPTYIFYTILPVFVFIIYLYYQAFSGSYIEDCPEIDDEFIDYDE